MSGHHPKIKPTDMQAAKRELLRVGRLQGYLTDDEIRASLPRDLITNTELETFFFTLEMMNIERRPGAEELITEDDTSKKPAHSGAL